MSGLNMDDYAKKFLGVNEDAVKSECEQIYTDMVKSGSIVIKAKGATVYAIAASVMQLLKAILADTHTILPLSALMHGEYGADNVCMGVPCMVGANGIEKVVDLPLSEEEKALFDEKISSLTATYDALGVRN